MNDGRWISNQPAAFGVFGNMEEMTLEGDQGNMSRAWCYSVEIGSHHLAANRILDPNSLEVGEMMDYLEDYQFLRTGWNDYSHAENQKDIFNLGGFSKLQPYYSRNVEIYALRDDVKPFIRSYFNALSTLLNTENLSLWEGFQKAGAWNKTHETGWLLCQTGLMFVMERGDELWLAPMVTNNWLKDGMTIAVQDAPTRFGPVSYRIASHVDDGYIEASIDPPRRTSAKQIVIRIRHPEDKAIRSVTVDGKPHAAFDSIAANRSIDANWSDNSSESEILTMAMQNREQRTRPTQLPASETPIAILTGRHFKRRRLMNMHRKDSAHMLDICIVCFRTRVVRGRFGIADRREIHRPIRQ